MSKLSKTGLKQKSHEENFPSKIFVGFQAKETLEKIDDTCLTIINFKKYAEELDARKDKFERLVKISRDITIESKRIIFLLHTIDRKSKKEAVLKEAEKRLENLLSNQCKQIAVELNEEDPYLYHKAFSPGLADVSGELMRKCINSLGSGEVEACLETCKFVRHLHTCFLSVGTWGNKEMSHKAFTLKQSLLKMEMLCYNIHIRGSEIPKHMLANIEVQKTYEDDEDGFFD